MKPDSTALSNRRNFIRQSALLLTGLPLIRLQRPFGLSLPGAASASHQARYQIGVSDLMIYKRQKIGAFALTHQIGAQGVEVDMGGLGDRPTFKSILSDPATCEAYLQEAEKYKLKICSVAKTGFYAQSFAKRPTWKRMIQDCLTTAQRLKVKTAFLPLGISCDLKKYPELRPVLIQRFREAGEMASNMGVVIGIETSLKAADERVFLEQIDSPGIKSYFNFANAVDNQEDICEALKTLGKDFICQIHGTNSDGVHLKEDPKVDLPAIKKTLDQMGWSGWLVLLRSRDQKDPKNVRYNFGANNDYMQSVFKA